MQRRAFTLVEMVVVILIVALLIALLLPAVQSARRAALRGAVGAEMRSMGVALASFKLKYGQYPPSCLVCSESGNYSAAFFGTRGFSATPATVARTLNFLRSAWPRLAVSTSATPATIPGIGFYDFNGNGQLDLMPYVMTGDECLAFFLGGIPEQTTGSAGNPVYGMIGFADNPLNPFQPGSYPDPSNTSKRIIPARAPSFFNFDNARLFDPDSDFLPSYGDIYSGSTQPTPYVYFATIGVNDYDPDDVNFAVEPDGSTIPTAAFGPVPSWQATTNLAGRPDVQVSAAPNPYTTGPPLVPSGAPPTAWAARDSYQILSAGDDRQYGPGGCYDAGSRSDHLPWDSATQSGAGAVSSGRLVERDNLASFATGQLGD